MKAILLLTVSVLFLFFGGCASPSTPSPEPPAESVLADSPSERRLVLDGRRYTYTGESSDLTVEEDRLTICAPGTYRLSGSLKDGRLRVCVAPHEVVCLILDGVEIHSSVGAPLTVEQAAAVVLETVDGTVNRLTDEAGTSETVGEIPIGCLESVSDLILRGKGTLVVGGRRGDGISCLGSVYLSDTSLTVSAVEDGLWVRNRLEMTGGSLSVTAATRGLVADGGEGAAGDLALLCGRLAVSAQRIALVAGDRIRLETKEATLHAPTRYRAGRLEVPTSLAD